ncbi:MAG: SAM-dependent methyltransferase [Pirellulaceae bacterium]|jgi:SAM-dependent methyltransferase
MSRITKYFDKTLYPSFAGNWDDEMFREMLLDRIQPEFSCLDYGAGRGNVAQMNFKGIAKFVAGIDPEEGVLDNPYLDEGKILDLSDNIIPFDDNTFDLVFSDNVMEHIQDPMLVLPEIHRVLKPGGVYLAKTPNKWHYMPMIARMTPIWFHRFYNKLRGRSTFDTFPTAYQLNSTADVKKFAAKTSFEVNDIRLIEGRPEYLRLTAPTYLCGYLYERLVNCTDVLSGFRCVLISELQKPSATAATQSTRRAA